MSWGNAVFALEADVDAGVRARAMLGRAFPHMALADVPAAEEVVKDAIDLSRTIGDREVLANALAIYGNVLAYRDPRSASPILDEAIEVARETEEVYALALALLYSGWCHRWAHGDPLGDRLLDEAIEVCRRHGEDDCLAEALAWRSAGAVLSGDYAHAEGDAEEAAALARHVGDFFPAVQSQMVLALAQRRQGHDERARASSIEDAAAELRRVAPEVARFTAVYEALIAFESGRISDGTLSADAAVAFCQAAGAAVVMPQALSIRGLLRWAAGDLAGSSASCREAIDAGAHIGVRWWDGLALEGLGRVARADGDLRASARVTTRRWLTVLGSASDLE